MPEAAPHSATTAVPEKSGGFPPFDVATFPSQIFWLGVTFVFLFVVLWRIAGPRIASTLQARRGRINDDLAAAQAGRTGAQAAEAAYQTALAAARARAQALAEANRKEVSQEIDRDKAAADAKTQDDIAKAETRIAATREEARGHVARAAGEAAIAIVAHLTGETVSAAEAETALAAARGA
jgi:F-type H+-transporting ATPase subunit b